MKKIRIGLIGAGGNTRNRHIPGFQELDGVEIVVVANRSEASSQKIAQEYGIPRIAKDWKAMVADPEVDAICIGTWPYMHAPITIAALEAGKHVLTEARMARNLEEAEAMYAASRSYPDLVAQVVPAPFTLRHDGLIVDAITSGRLGQLREVRLTHATGGAARSDTALSWRQDSELSGLNVMSMGILYESAQRVLGDEDPQWVAAEGAVFTSRRQNAAGESVEIDIPEVLTVTAGYADGKRMSLYISTIDSGLPEFSMRYHGSEGSLRFDVGKAELYFAAVGTAEEKLLEAPADAIGWNVEADFIRSIRSGAAVKLTNFADGVRYMRFTQRVWESYQSEGSRIRW